MVKPQVSLQQWLYQHWTVQPLHPWLPGGHWEGQDEPHGYLGGPHQVEIFLPEETLCGAQINFVSIFLALVNLTLNTIPGPRES